MIRKFTLCFLWSVFGSILHCVAQDSEKSTEEMFHPHKSIHQEQSEYYAQFNLQTNAQWDSLRLAQRGVTKKTLFRNPTSCTLNKRVYGWHPYWSNGLESNYDWNGLTDLCYFSYDVNSATGGPTSTHGWATASVVTTAQANGVNVSLCATLFSGHSAFFASTTAQQTLITNLINFVQSRNAHGVNIDFEGMTSSMKVPFTNFMIDLCNQMHAAIPGSEVSIALYAVDWGSVFDMATLNSYVDLFIIMGYDYYYSGSTTAGPEDPLYNFQTSYNYTLTKSITYYLKQGASKSKLLLGLPYYGREWATTANTAPSSTTGTGTNTVFYNDMRANINGYYSTRNWEINSSSSWYISNRSGTWWQAFVDDSYSMGKRFDVVNLYGIGGIGIWALGYDDGYTDFWDLIRNKFTNCAVVPCTDTIYDMGGPTRNYYDNENYTFTIAPTGATGLSLNFSSFATELNYDTLWIYDGSSTASPLIGYYHGTVSPGLITASGNSLTLRYKSDNATQAAGWQAIWQCSTDHTVPTTAVSAPSGWATADFTANFTDIDNTGGSGIAKSYYQVLENNGTEWRANNGNGFFSDNFDTAIHPDWTSMTGTWSIAAGGYLQQSDETNSNTNIYAPLTQNLSNQYLYNWQGKISGTGTNRRAGFHFFCDDGTLSNRGNSYFVWIRPDQGTFEIYKVTSNVFSLMYTNALSTTINTWYDYKVIYDRITGKISFFVNNVLAGSWTDTSPLSNGNAISFRSGNCNYQVNDLKVYRSRYPSVTVSVGAASTNDIRYQNANPTSPSGRVKSITRDNADNLSVVASQDINVDWTPPTTVSVADGTLTDVDTCYSLTQLQGNWSASTDPNSGIANYWYSIGTTPGATDVQGWTNNSGATGMTQTGLSLVVGQLYYINVKTEDGAGLISTVTSSDGQLLVVGTGISEDLENGSIVIFPNPCHAQSTLYIDLKRTSRLRITLMDLQGKELEKLADGYFDAGKQEFKIETENKGFSSGMYLMRIEIGNQVVHRKLMIN